MRGGDLWIEYHDAVVFFFFFSSRRRHTRLTCDWSSDVCSSDLNWASASASISTSRSGPTAAAPKCGRDATCSPSTPRWARRPTPSTCAARTGDRSEERRVGKECRARWSADHQKKKESGEDDG